MRALVISRLKGGVGKTFLPKHLGWFLADREGQRVACIDLDPQGRSTRRIAAEHRIGFAADLFDPDARIAIAPGPGLEVFAADVRGFLLRFGELRAHFDPCIIDTGHKRDEFSSSALAAADVIIAPGRIAEDSIECAKMLLAALGMAEIPRARRKLGFPALCRRW